MKFKPDVTDEQIVAMSSALNDLPAQIPVIRSTRHGRDIGQRPTNFDYSLVSEFDSIEELHVYLAHPAHQDVAANYVLELSETMNSVQFES